MTRTTILVTGPDVAAMSGVSTHVALLLHSRLAYDFDLVHFQVGSEGRDEGPLARWLRLAWSPFGLLIALLSKRAAILHLNTSLNPRAYWRDLAYLFVAKLCGVRVLYQVHGGALPRKFFEGNPILTGFLRFTLGLPDAVVVLAQCELAAYRQFVPAQNVTVIPNGIDCRPFDRVGTVRSTSDQPLRLLYIGRIAREKGLYEVAQGMRLATELGVDERLVIAGGGPEEPRLRRYVQALGLAPRVSFVGPAFGRDKVRLLDGADAFVLASYSEGLPYALLESMAAGVPVIATPVGAIPDVVTHGTHGLLVRPRDAKDMANALAVLAADRERISWMSRACRRRIRAAFAIERVASEFSEMYRRIQQVGGRRPEVGGNLIANPLAPRSTSHLTPHT
jgi:glycosyltransferase involved in cell wall biosynthesis